ncbi:MAG: hypothetical protein GY753_09275 [Gammaproteobacteria bacterium]|nr:hypothetical protein [Gammaproteobacteria bacterium]
MTRDPANITVQIDRLLVDGFSRSDAHVIRDAFESQLKNLLASGAQKLTESTSHCREQVTPPPVKSSSPREIGAASAREVYEALRR